MTTVMRAKLRVTSVKKTEGQQEVLELTAVVGGSDEDNNYSKFTPSANLTMVVSNPDLLGKFEPGQRFYVDFSSAE